MLSRDVIDLIVFSEDINENGFLIETEVSRETVYANKKSIRGNEFYLASQNGYRLEILFEIRTSDYQNEKYLEFDGKRYEIIRTYDKGEFIELSCQAFVGK